MSDITIITEEHPQPAGGGTGADEVWIGAAEPVDPALELWYDTDAVASPMTDDQRWATAWGIVAKGTLQPAPVTVPQGSAYHLCGSVNVATVAGRRYRLAYVVRAYGQGTTAISTRFVPSSSPSTLVAPAPAGLNRDHYIGTPRAWQGSFLPWQFDGDDTTATVHVLAQGSSLADAIVHHSELYVEDVGPLTGPPAVIPAPAPSWSPLELAAGYTPEAGSLVPAFRVLGDVVEFRGCARFTGTWSTAAGGNLGTLPPGARPLATVRFMLGAHKAAVGGAYVFRGAVNPSGTMSMSDYGATDKADPVIYLDGWSFTLGAP